MTEHPPAQPIQNPLTLVMKAKCAASYASLRQAVEHLQALPADQNPITIALDKIATVHFARFAFLDSAQQLFVITSYDYDFETYIKEFVDFVGDIFNQLLAFVEDAPPLPVQTYRQEFLDYVRRNDLRCVEPFYSAYPDRTVVSILDPADGHS